MNDGRKLSFVEFLADLRGVIVSPGRRFPAIHERGALWGSLFLLVAPIYLPMSYLGGIYFTRDPFPGYSFIMPLVGAAVSTVVKLFGIHLVARLFEGRWHYRAGTGRFRDLFVVFGYAGLPSIMAFIAAIVIFIGLCDQVLALFRDFRPVTISILVALGIALFIWNLILSVLALRTVYSIRDYKIVISVLVGPVLVAIPLVAGSLIVTSAHIDSAMVTPILNKKVAVFVSSDPEAQDPGRNKISFHVDLLAYKVRAPRRFELVAFSPLRDEQASGSRKGGRVVMKSGIHQWFSSELRDQLAGRIVGLPGDEVELRQGRLRINGQYWQENYIAPQYRCAADFPATRLEPSEYLVLPEDRNLVEKLRGQLIVDRSRITGRLIIVRWPIGWWLFRPTVFEPAVPAT